MPFDQEHRARIGADRAVESVRDRLQFRSLIRRNLPRSGFEVDAVEVDARHALAHRGAVTDFVQRITPLNPLYRWRDHGVVDQIGRSVLGIDDIAIIRNTDHRGRQIDIESADPARAAITVVDDDDLAASWIPADPAQQQAVTTTHINDLRAVGSNHDGTGFAANLLGPDVARPVP